MQVMLTLALKPPWERERETHELGSYILQECRSEQERDRPFELLNMERERERENTSKYYHKKW